MNSWALYIILMVASVGSLFLTILQLPGLWMMIAFAGGYAWLTSSAYVGVWTMVVLIALGIVAEVLETLASAHGARRAGASRTATLASVAGALFGGIFLSFIPIPVVGTIAGVCLGAFLGAAVVELLRGKGHQQSIHSGLGAAVGRLVGTIAKLVIGVAMLLILLFAALPW